MIEREATLKELSEAIAQIFLQLTQIGIVLDFLSQELKSQLNLELDRDKFDTFATEALARLRELK